MTTNDITLDDARLAEIEEAARNAEPGEWDTQDGHIWAKGNWWIGRIPPIGPEGSLNHSNAAHIVATQPRVALAMVAEIRRLRDIIETNLNETIRVLRGEEGGVS